jgi:hypothetical protein
MMKFRTEQGTPLSHEDVDNNFKELQAAAVGTLRKAPNSPLDYEYIWTGTADEHKLLGQYPSNTRFDIILKDL